MKKIFDLINRNILLETHASLINSNRPIITISREKGSGGSIIAKKLAGKLGRTWKVYHKEIVEAIARETNLEKNLVAQVDENNIPAIEKIIDEMFGQRYLNFSAYFKQLVRVLSTIGARGRAIIIGRGTNFLLPRSLKVRIICEMKQRIEWLMKYERLTEAQAKKLIFDSDNKRYDFVKKLFSHDVKKAHHYDLIIRTSRDLSIDDAVEIITHAAKRRFRL